jgi:hypothetical protein
MSSPACHFSKILHRLRRFVTVLFVSPWILFFYSLNIPESFFNTIRMVSPLFFNAVAMFLAERLQLRLIRSRIVLMTAEVETDRFRVDYLRFSM